MARLLHVGLGPLGMRVLEDVVAAGRHSLVAAVDVDPALVGRRIGDLVKGAPDWDVDADLEAALERGAPEIALVTTVSDLPRSAPTFRALLQRGIAVVSSCEELLWPWLRHPDLARELDDAARASGGRLLGTGVNPGFVMDTLPVVLSAVCPGVRGVHVERSQDATTRRLPFQRKIGATLAPAEFERRARSGALRHVGLGESLHCLAAALGWTVERWDEQLEPVLATEDTTCRLGPIPAGHALGVRQVARGWVAGRLALELNFHAAIGTPNPRDRVVLDADPRVELTIPGGVHGDVATSAILRNAFDRLVEAPPGLHTMTSIPPVRARGL